MANFIVIVIVLLAVAAAVAYIVKEKKRGVHCIGCPQAGMCTKKNCNCAGASGNKDSESVQKHTDK